MAEFFKNPDKYFHLLARAATRVSNPLNRGPVDWIVFGINSRLLSESIGSEDLADNLTPSPFNIVKFNTPVMATVVLLKGINGRLWEGPGSYPL